MIKVAIVTDKAEEKLYKEALKDLADVSFCPSYSEEVLIKNAKDAEILISVYEPITRRVIESLPKLSYIALLSIGYNLIDFEAAKEHGLWVSNNPEYCVQEVAEHTCGMILSLARRLPEYNRLIKEEKIWEPTTISYPIHRLSELTLGLIGFGRIGKRVAKLMKAFNMEVIAYDPYVSEEVMTKLGVKKQNLETVLKNSDILSLHAPLNEETHHLLNRENLCLLKPSAKIINTARGTLIEQDALLEMLEQNAIDSAALDVIISESPDEKILESYNKDNLILSPHSAYYSLESVRESHESVISYVRAFIGGRQDEIPFILRKEPS